MNHFPLKTLYLLRHGEADTARHDLERDLHIRGRRQAEYIGRWMSEMGISLDLMISSPAKRAKATAAICSEFAGYNDTIRVEDDLYDADGDACIDILKQLDDPCHAVMLVGHNPEISDVVTILTGNKIHVTPCMLVCMEFEIEKWEAVLEGYGRLKWFQKPS